jgi:hypothetical protein
MLEGTVLSHFYISWWLQVPRSWTGPSKRLKRTLSLYFIYSLQNSKCLFIDNCRWRGFSGVALTHLGLQFRAAYVASLLSTVKRLNALETDSQVQCGTAESFRGGAAPGKKEGGRKTGRTLANRLRLHYLLREF